MTKRYQKLTLSYYNEDIYKDTIMFLKDFMDIVQEITVRDRKWKSFQSSLLLCTQTALDLQIEYLEKEKFYFLLLGRFTQDVNMYVRCVHTCMYIYVHAYNYFS